MARVRRAPRLPHGVPGRALVPQGHGPGGRAAARGGPVTGSVRRALGIVALAIVLAIGCTFAGFWQWQRGEDRERAIRTVIANYTAGPVTLDALLGTPDTPLPAEDAWRPVILEGEYVPGATVLLRNRPVAGTPSFHLLAPFTVTAPGTRFDGAVIVVDRGWIPIGTDASGDVEIPDPPSGTVTLEVRVRPAERVSDRAAPAGQAHSIFPAQVVGSAGLAPEAVVAGAYASLVSESPPPAVVPGLLDAPSTDYGPHRSYALQWWVFALGGLVAFGVIAFREWRGEADDDDVPADDGAPQVTESPTELAAPARTKPASTKPARTKQVRQRRRPTAEEEEDALLDAQEVAQASETRSR
ncbi:MAG: SURF1 family protein [Actinomycetales bacterium]|nr:SURF1 family protein [Actinomycetales bacterium]